MSKTEQEILQVLTQMVNVVKTSNATGPKPDLLELFERIDELAARLPRDAAPELVHFLQRKSYEKARLWLEDRRVEIARGGCGH